jgi:hypothetical protein
MPYGYDKEIKVSQRTGKKTAALVGFAPTTRHLAPWDDPDTVIVCLNEAYRIAPDTFDKEPFLKRWDIWFQIHSWKNVTRPDNKNDPHHFEWLTRQDKPIYMQKAWTKYIPSAVCYPLKAASTLGKRYFTSSCAYMTALAILLGFERIEFYGFEMGSGTEYAHQRACQEFWMGLGMGRGLDIWTPDVCRLLKDKLYAYEMMSIGYRQQLELRTAGLKQQLTNATNKFHQMAGALTAYTMLEKDFPDGVPAGECGKRAKAQEEQAQKEGQTVNLINGAHEESLQMTKFYDQYPFEDDNGEEADFYDNNPVIDGYDSEVENDTQTPD